MMLKNVIAFTTLLLIVSAIGLLFFPSKMLAVVGIVSNDQLDFLLRTTGAGVASLIPGAWAVRTSPASQVSRAVLIGLAVYMFLSSVVDLHAYTKSIVNTASIPSIAFRVLLGTAMLPLTFKGARQKVNLIYAALTRQEKKLVKRALRKAPGISRSS